MPKPFVLSLLACVALGQPAFATGAPHGSGPAAEAPPRSAAAVGRFPQPVRAGDLAGRQLLEDRPNQRVLGRIGAVVAGADGSPSLVVRRQSWWGGDAGEVMVPVGAVALLGQFVVLKGLEPAQLAALPVRGGPAPTPLAATAVIEVGLARN